MSDELYIFDFDDTLVDSGAKVVVTRSSGEELSLSSAAYRDYDRRYKEDGDEVNFSEFDVYPPGASVIKSTWSSFLSALSSVGQGNVMILTARENPIPVKEFLSNAGVSPLPIIEAVGDSNPDAKKRVVAEYVRALGIKKVYLWEDSSANISSIESLRSDELEITSTLVSEGILRKLIQRIIREAQVF
jgi:hypothetical protein